MAKKRQRTGKRADDNAPAPAMPAFDDAGGHDWGWPASSMIVGTTGLPQRLAQGGFTGCGYGILPDGGPPFLALFGERMEGMGAALSLMREWSDAAGPNAIRVEILFDGAGYVISIGQQIDLLSWRLRGIDSVDDSFMASVNVMKRFDTRHPDLERLAQYSRQPLAPVLLTVAKIPDPVMGHQGYSGRLSAKVFERKGILLPGIHIYTGTDERPPNSMVRLGSEMPGEDDRGPPPEPARDASSITDKRERRLLATMPKTMHAMRNRRDARALVAEMAAHGCAQWQAEQAVCNLRITSHLPYEPRGRSKRSAMLDVLRRDFIEPASTPFDPRTLTPVSIGGQVALDAAFLLRRLQPEAAMPDDLAGRCARLRELGHA